MYFRNFHFQSQMGEGVSPSAPRIGVPDDDLSSSMVSVSFAKENVCSLFSVSCTRELDSSGGRHLPEYRAAFGAGVWVLKGLDEAVGLDQKRVSPSLAKNGRAVDGFLSFSLRIADNTGFELTKMGSSHVFSLSSGNGVALPSSILGLFDPDQVAAMTFAAIVAVDAEAVDADGTGKYGSTGCGCSDMMWRNAHILVHGSRVIGPFGSDSRNPDLVGGLMVGVNGGLRWTTAAVSITDAHTESSPAEGISGQVMACTETRVGDEVVVRTEDGVPVVATATAASREDGVPLAPTAGIYGLFTAVSDSPDPGVGMEDVKADRRVGHHVGDNPAPGTFRSDGIASESQIQNGLCLSIIWSGMYSQIGTVQSYCTLVPSPIGCSVGSHCSGIEVFSMLVLVLPQGRNAIDCKCLSNAFTGTFLLDSALH